MLTRKDDTFVELGERPRRAAREGADLFLAIHFNAGPPTVTGIETYTVPPQYQRSTASDLLTKSKTAVTAMSPPPDSNNV